MNTRRWLVWHILAAAVVLGAATLARDGTPLLELPLHQWAFFLALPLTHLAGALALWWQAVQGARPHVIRAAVTMILAYGLFALGWLMVSGYYSRGALAASLMLSVFLTVVPLVFARHLHRMTTFNNLKLTVSNGHIDSDVDGGSIRLLSPGFIIAEGQGALYYMDELVPDR